jgi:hypothetical protein
MGVYRLQCTWAADSAFPRDGIVITPHFDVGAMIPDDADQLCEDLADALATWQSMTLQLTVKAYKADDPAPNAPIGSAIRHVAAHEASIDPRELAICLSFYGGENVPSKRGRLYVPACIAARGGTGAKRPNATAIAKVAALAPIFEGLGGTDVDWCVWSRKNQSMASVTNWWVDNEWDIIRSRGLRPDARTVGTTSEG